MDFNNNNTYTYKEPKGPKMKINKDKAKKGIMLVVAVFIVAVLGFNSFFTINLNCVCIIRCLDDTYVECL